MKHTIIFRVIAALFIFSLYACKTEESKPKPSIISLTPEMGGIGTTVVITGANFDVNTSNITVKFNGVTAKINTSTATTIQTEVPAGVSTGVVTVTTPLGTAMGPSFVYIGPPTITSISPTKGNAPDVVTIVGTNFSPVLTNNTVRFNGIDANVISATPNTITVTVPVGATTGPITVKTNDGTATSSIFTYGPDVYSLGTISNSVPTPGFYATYWKNNQSNRIVSTNEIQAFDIEIVGADVFISGLENLNGFWVATLWKNGVPTYLTPNSTSHVYGAMARAITVLGLDSYCAGIENYRATFWKNTKGITLSDNLGSIAYDIAVSSEDIYVCGQDFIPGSSTNAAVFWKNGVITYLTDGTKSATATLIKVFGNDVYVGVNESNGSNYVAKYWKNGNPVIVSDPTRDSYFGDIVFVNNDIHLTWLEKSGNNYILKYAKNGVTTSITDGKENAIGGPLSIIENDVYILGREGRSTKYWKNGKPVSFNSSEIVFSQGKTLVVR